MVRFEDQEPDQTRNSDQASASGNDFTFLKVFILLSPKIHHEKIAKSKFFQ